MDRFGQQELVYAVIGMMTLIAGGFLFLLFRTPAALSVEKRVTDYAAEMAAGTLPNMAVAAKPVEEVDIAGTFVTFDGKPGTTKARWDNFRGADFTNIVESEVPLAEQWPEGGPPQLWEIDLGEGYAGAVVWDGCVYVIDYDEEKEGDALRVFSTDDGKEIWRRFYKAPTKANHGVSRTVPAVTEDYVVTVGPRCHTLCVDRKTGDFKWGIDMVAEYGTEVPLWYTGQCPLIDGKTAVLAPGGKALMIGVDCETGNVDWLTPNPKGWKMSHSSITPMTLLGRKTYVYCSVGGVIGVSAEEGDRGALLWETNAWTHSVISPSPVAIDENRIFLTAGYGGGSMMLGLKEEGGKIMAEPSLQAGQDDLRLRTADPDLLQGSSFCDPAQGLRGAPGTVRMSQHRGRGGLGERENKPLRTGAVPPRQRPVLSPRRPRGSHHGPGQARRLRSARPSQGSPRARCLGTDGPGRRKTDFTRFNENDLPRLGSEKLEAF